jgi:hypothetical protein
VHVTVLGICFVRLTERAGHIRGADERSEIVGGGGLSVAFSSHWLGGCVLFKGVEFTRDHHSWGCICCTYRAKKQLMGVVVDTVLGYILKS